MNSVHKFSIIIPCYNQACYLSAAVNSVLAQQGIDQEQVEIIVVNDGSTDHTAEVITSFCDQIVAISQNNQGLSAARNTGMRHATGEWLLPLDSDDVLLPGALSAFLQAETEHPEAAVIYGGVQRMTAEGEPLCDITPRPCSNKMLQSLLMANRLTVGAVCMRRSLAMQVGEYDTSLKSAEDWDYWIRSAATGARFHQIPALVLGYRTYGDSMSRNYERMVVNMTAVSRKHANLARKSIRTWIAWKIGKRVMRYYCWNQILRPHLSQLWREGQPLQMFRTLAKAACQDCLSVEFYLFDLWLLSLAACCFRLVDVKTEKRQEKHVHVSSS